MNDRCHVRLATLIGKNVVSMVNIKYMYTPLKMVRPGIARTHGMVELASMVPTSLSHQSSTVDVLPFQWVSTVLQIMGRVTANINFLKDGPKLFNPRRLGIQCFIKLFLHVVLF